MKNLLSLLLVLFIAGCYSETAGTDLGNPGKRAPDAATLESNPVDDIILNFCVRLSVCKNEFLNDCSQQILAQQNIDTELGLTTGEFSNLEEFRTTLIEDQLSWDVNAEKRCEQDLSLLDCDSPNIQNAYLPNSSDPYQRAAEAFPNSCQEVF